MTAGTLARPASLRAVIFDLDGTLVDTADEFVVVVQALRAEHGRDPMDPARIRASVSNGARALVSLALDMAEESAGFEDQRLRLLELYSEVLGTVAGPYPGITALLAELAGRGVRWGIATNKPRAYTDPLLQRLGMQPPPASVVCPDDVTERKPHPESLLRNCRELGCTPAEAIYVGDHLRDIEAGRRAGMYTIAAAYGYIEPGDDPRSWGADAHAENSLDLRTLILGS
ncbi:MAG: HAD-IA family hydrolase [Gammaproteobacteria bacterium]|nr:HAD-IA family hydrolase [Gammaproteobacteria bacterium]